MPRLRLFLGSLTTIPGLRRHIFFSRGLLRAVVSVGKSPFLGMRFSRSSVQLGNVKASMGWWMLVREGVLVRIQAKVLELPTP